MYSEYVIEKLIVGRHDDLRRLAHPVCPLERPARIAGLRETAATALVKLGLLLHHDAGEQAAAHVHRTPIASG